MHTYPLIIVDGCKSPEDAVHAAETESEWILNYGVYDSAGRPEWKQPGSRWADC